MLGTVKRHWRNLQRQLGLLTDIAHYINLVKNGQSVATGENEVLTRIYTGQLMYVDRRDLSVAPHLMMSGLWEFEIVELFRRYVKQDSVVLDVGANFGFFGIVAGVHNPFGELHFFDANPVFAPFIRKSLFVNGLNERARVTSAAISHRSGEQVMLNGENDLWGSSSLRPIVASEFVSPSEPIAVSTLSIDDYCEEKGIGRVDLVKLDIEGHEEAALKGMRRLIEANPQLVIFMEYTFGAYTGQFFGLLQQRFRISAIVDGEVRPVKDEMHLRAMGKGWIMLILEPLQ